MVFWFLKVGLRLRSTSLGGYCDLVVVVLVDDVSLETMPSTCLLC